MDSTRKAQADFDGTDIFFQSLETVTDDRIILVSLFRYST